MNICKKISSWSQDHVTQFFNKIEQVGNCDRIATTQEIDEVLSQFGSDEITQFIFENFYTFNNNEANLSEMDLRSTLNRCKGFQVPAIFDLKR